MRLGFADDPDDGILRFYRQARALGTWSPQHDVTWVRETPLDGERAHMAWRIASQGSYNESIGMMTAAELLAQCEDPATRVCLATAVADEARHSEAFAHYARWAGGSLEAPSQHADALHAGLAATDSYNRRFLAHTFLEGFASDQFSFFARLFAGDPLGQIYRLVRRDEARHVAIGIACARRLAQRDAAFADDLRWVDEHIGAIAQQSDAMFAWLGDLLGIPGPRLRRVFETRHAARVKRILQREGVTPREESQDHQTRQVRDAGVRLDVVTAP